MTHKMLDDFKLGPPAMLVFTPMPSWSNKNAGFHATFPATLTKWKYRAIYRVDNAQIGFVQMLSGCLPLDGVTGRELTFKRSRRSEFRPQSVG